jgi:death-on-curing protein
MPVCPKPQQQFGGAWLHPDLPAMAAAYLFHIACDHPFIDGNKRVAAMAAFVFLDINGVDLRAPPDEFEGTVLAIAAGLLSKADLAEWMRAQTRPRA